MKIEVRGPGSFESREPKDLGVLYEAEISGEVILSSVFSAIGIRTSDDAVFGVCLRDSGLEIKCPDGTLVGVKRYGWAKVAVVGDVPAEGETFIERNGEVVA